MVELIRDPHSSIYNTGKVLVEKMLEIAKEGQVYYWKIDPEKRYTDEQQRLYESRAKRAFVKIGDGSNATLTKSGKPLGAFDRLVKWEGTTNCSTAVLDALYRTLGGKVGKKGAVITIGGVNGVPLTDASFSGFNNMFQGPNWDDALVQYALGYKVAIKDLRYGDIIGTGGHRMVFVETVTVRDGAPTTIKAIQANLPTGEIAVRIEPFAVKDNWKLARLFDMRH
jgi:hypothetical protein